MTSSEDDIPLSKLSSIQNAFPTIQRLGRGKNNADDSAKGAPKKGKAKKAVKKSLPTVEEQDDEVVLLSAETEYSTPPRRKNARPRRKAWSWKYNVLQKASPGVIYFDPFSPEGDTKIAVDLTEIQRLCLEEELVKGNDELPDISLLTSENETNEDLARVQTDDELFSAEKDAQIAVDLTEPQRLCLEDELVKGNDDLPDISLLTTDNEEKNEDLARVKTECSAVVDLSQKDEEDQIVIPETPERVPAAHSVRGFKMDYLSLPCESEGEASDDDPAADKGRDSDGAFEIGRLESDTEAAATSELELNNRQHLDADLAEGKAADGEPEDADDTGEPELNDHQHSDAELAEGKAKDGEPEQAAARVYRRIRLFDEETSDEEEARAPCTTADTEEAYVTGEPEVKVPEKTAESEDDETVDSDEELKSDEEEKLDHDDSDDSTYQWPPDKHLKADLFPKIEGEKKKLFRVWSRDVSLYRKYVCLAPPSGYRGKCKPESDPSEFCDELLDDAVRYMVTRTNRKMRSSGRQKQVPVTRGEMYAYLGAYIVMGFNNQPELHSYFSREPELGNVAIQRAFTRRRFAEITKHLCYTQQKVLPAGPLPRTQKMTTWHDYLVARQKEDPIMKVRTFLSHINRKFRAVRLPRRELCVDESMTKFKGRSSIKVRIPKKPVPMGFEHFTLSEARTGYIFNDEAHVGKQVKMVFHEDELPNPEFKGNFMGKVTAYLARHYLGKGHHLVFDNRFTSARLLEYLFLHHKTTAVGSLRGNSAQMPTDYKTLYKAKVTPQDRGQHTMRQNGRLVLTAWKDKSTLCILSTGTNPMKKTEIVTRRCGAQTLKFPCPFQVTDYQNNYKGVDLTNQLSTTYRVGRRCQRWHRYFFFHKINQVLVNAYINWKDVNNREQPHQNRSQLHFRMRVARRYLERVAQRANVRNVEPVTGRIHQLERSDMSRRCVVCKANKKRHESVKRCNVCKVHLCNPSKRPQCLRTHVQRMCR